MSADSTWASDRFATGLSSGEGLIYAVRDPVEKNVADEDGGSVSKVVDEGVAKSTRI